MKSPSSLLRFVTITGSSLLAISNTHGANGTWLGTTGNWGTPGTWSGGTIADAAGFTANFTGVNIASDRIITLDTIRTIGNITFTDTTTSSNNLTISGANTLTLDVASGAPAIDVTQVDRTLTISSVIAGNDGLQKNGSGTLVLTGNNSYTGTTTVSNGTLSVGDGTTNGTLGGSYVINNSGTLRIRYNNSGVVTAAWTSTIWNNFTGSGSLALKTGKNNDGWGNVALPNTFTGTLQIESGRVVTNSVTGAGFGGATAIKILAGGQLTDWRGSSITQDLTIAGTGYGEGGLECAIRMGDGSNISNISGLVALSASATIGANGTGILTNVISGAAGSTLTIGTTYCNGKVILAADNTYAGATSIAYGTLQIGNGGATGALGSGAITNNGTLIFNHSDTVNMSQAITGSGAVKQEGSGTVTLGVANSYSGATTITSGTLTLGVNGALPTGSAVSIGSATLNAGTSVNSAGTLGVTLGVTGPAKIVFGSGATLAFTNSSALSWTGFLQMGGNFVSGVSLRVGTTSSGLTADQLARINAQGFTNFALNAQGYLTANTVAHYNTWQTANSTSQSLNEDLDGDGVPNGTEYFLHGTGDSSVADVLPPMSGSPGSLSITWTKASTYPGIYGTDFVVQTSSTLAAGSWTNQPLGTNVVITGNNVKYTFPAGNKNFARLLVSGEAEATPLVIDTSDAIPLRSAIYRKDQFNFSLRGSAIKGTTPYEANFDTGSLQTCLPYGALNKANLTVIQTNVRTVWGKLADKVTGQLMLKSRDGLTDYTIDNFTIYAMKNEDGNDMADDRTAQWSVSICGAGPTDNSIVAALMAKYSTGPNGLGAGIISESPGGNLASNWSSHKSYLKFGNDPAIASRLNWYHWSPWFNGQTEFDALTIPGFKFTYKFPAVSGLTHPDIVIPNQIATIDSGAPEFVMRLGPSDPHRQPPYSQFFNSTNVPAWYSTAACQAVNKGVTINVEFTGSTGKTSYYSFPAANYDDNAAYVPNIAFIGNWASNVPWTPNSAAMPMNRMNLGNSVYFYAKVYFWDFTNQRVGFYFN